MKAKSLAVYGGMIKHATTKEELENQVPTDCQQVSYHFTEQEEARHA